MMGGAGNGEGRGVDDLDTLCEEAGRGGRISFTSNTAWLVREVEGVDVGVKEEVVEGVGGRGVGDAEGEEEEVVVAVIVEEEEEEEVGVEGVGGVEVELVLGVGVMLKVEVKV